MAETQLRVRWPDGTTTSHYCPSHVVKKFLTVGQQYPVAVFLATSRAALEAASERVRAHFGYPCSRAFDAIGNIEQKARSLEGNPLESVQVEGFDDF